MKVYHIFKADTIFFLVFEDITVINTKTLCGPHRYMVEKAQKMKEALNAKKMMEEAIAGADIEIHELSPVFVTQGGPQCVAIQYIEK